MSFLSPDKLQNLYFSGLSMSDIAKQQKVSVHKVAYWMNKYQINRRPISEAIYLKNNPTGNPFIFNPPFTINETFLLGLGLGLFWGEGNKANNRSVRLGNTDPDLIKTFMRFLIEIFGVKKDKLKFGLQIFTDIDPKIALDYWMKKLEIKSSQFYKTVITPSYSLGTYRKKSKYGVIILYYHNKKLRDLIVEMVPKWLSGRAAPW